jgi:hypothetical protein
MCLSDPTICLHSDVFRIATVVLKLVSTANHSDSERFLTAS